MADVRVASTGDALPLLDPDGGGVYNVGRNNSLDIRSGLLSSIYATAGGSFTVRPGVLTRAHSAGNYTSLRVVQQSTASRWVDVNPGITIHTRSGQGPYPAYWNSATSIQAPLADATNPRIDIVVARLYDKAAFPADPFHGPYIEVIEGVASSSPVAKAIPDGAVLLAELFRDAGTPGDTITQAKITDKRKAAHIAGTPRILLPGDPATGTGSEGAFPGDERYRTVGGVLQPVEYWGVDSRWHGTVPQVHAQAMGVGTELTFASYTAMTLAIPDPGWPFQLHTQINWHGLSGTPVNFTVAGRLDTATGALLTSEATYNSGGGSDGITTPANADLNFAPSGRSATLNGAYTILLRVNHLSGGAGTRTWQVGTSITATVIPV